MNNDYNKWTNQFWNDIQNIAHFTTQPYSEYWVDYFSEIPNKEKVRVLDLGCGGGRNSKMLYEMGFELRACDLYSGMVRATQNTLQKVGMSSLRASEVITQQAMTRLAYPDAYFDIVLSHGVFHNALSFADYKNALRECARVLKRGGKLCFNIFYKRGQVDKTLKRINAKQYYYLTKENLPTILLPKKDFLEVAKEAGLTISGNIFEYSSNVTTGRREVLRGILTKV